MTLKTVVLDSLPIVLQITLLNSLIIIVICITAKQRHHFHLNTVLGQHSDHLDHRANLLEPVVCACAQKKRDSVNMVCILGADMISVASNIHWPFSMLVLLAHPYSGNGNARTQRAHSSSTDLLHNATREEISGKKPLLLVITASQLCVAL